MSRDRIDPESREVLDAFLEAVPGGFNAIPDIVDRRAAVDQMLEAMQVDLPPNENVITEDRVITGPQGEPDISVRVFRPVGVTGVLPGLYYIHGGGMVLGSVDGDSLIPAMLCEELGSVVVSIEYNVVTAPSVALSMTLADAL